jgi:hypothetical protein
MREATKEYFKQIDINFREWKEKAAGSRKDFAALVMNSGDWTPAYFNLWEGRCDSAISWTTNMVESGKLAVSSLDTILSKINSYKKE